MYGSYDNISHFDLVRKQFLCYQAITKSIGSISLKVKPSIDNNSFNRTILTFAKEGTRILEICLNKESEVCVRTESFNYNSKIKMINDTFNQLFFLWANNGITLKVNESEQKTKPFTQLGLNNADIYLASGISNYAPIDHLNGKIQMFSICDKILSIEEMNKIINNGSIIDARVTYDSDNRIAKKEVTNKEKKLTRKYFYHEESNKLNLLPSKEIDETNNEIIYSYDEYNNITHQLTINSNNEVVNALYFEYDGLKRLKKETKFKGLNSFIYDYRYAYDKNGNIKEKISLSETGDIIYKDTYLYSESIKDRLVTIKRLENNIEETRYQINYEENNHLRPKEIIINNDKNQLLWQGKNLIKFGKANFKYNENNIRISKTIDEREITYHLLGNWKVNYKVDTKLR